MPYRARAALLLEEWRQVERTLREATDEGAKDQLSQELERVRANYQQAVDDALAADAAVPDLRPLARAFDGASPTD